MRSVIRRSGFRVQVQTQNPAFVTSIKQSLGGSAATGPQPRLPNFCNLGVMLRLIVVVNLACAAAVLVKVQHLEEIPALFLAASVVVQPALILSLLLLCGMRRWLGSVSPREELALFAGTQMLIGGAGYYIMRGALPESAQLAAWQYVFLDALASGVVVYYFDMRSRALSPSLTEARLQALQARIRPHFLFNSMNAALSLIRSEPKRAERVLENMAELFRGLMHDNRRLVRLDEEVALCLNYLEIEEIRLGDRLKATWKIAAMPANALVPPLLIQPLIENAVYHGIEPLDSAGELVIEIAERGKQLVIVLTNPLPGVTGPAAHSHVQSNRMAIANIRERLQLHFDAEASLVTRTENGQFCVTIVLPNLEREP